MEIVFPKNKKTIKRKSNHYPIVILGPGRTGSTLLTEVLNAHSKLSISDEANYIPQFARLVRENLLGLPKKEIKQFTLQYLNGLYKLFYKNRNGIKRYGDKCLVPGTQEFTSINDLYSNRCVFIWMFRNPFDCALSYLERAKTDPEFIYGQYLRNSGKEKFIHWVLSLWRDSVISLEKCRAAYPQRTTICFYENLVLHPEKSLKEIHSFLGENLEPDQLHKALVSQKRVIPVGDPKISNTKNIHPKSAYRWRNIKKTDLIEFIKPYKQLKIELCMNYLGYAEENLLFKRRLKQKS